MGDYCLLELIEAKRELVAKHLQRYDVCEKTGCHIWNGATRHAMDGRPETAYGYVSFKINGANIKVGAHRLSFANHYGIDPKDLVVMHKCDRPPCINPECLKPGTHKDNAIDREKKGRGVPRSILTIDEAKWCASVLPFRADSEIAAMLDNKVQPETIRQLRTGRIWSDVTGIKWIRKRGIIQPNELAA